MYIKIKKGVVAEVTREKPTEGAFYEVEGNAQVGDTLDDYYIDDKNKRHRKPQRDIWLAHPERLPVTKKIVDGEIKEKPLKEQFEEGVITKSFYVAERSREIVLELAEIDNKTIRPLRACLTRMQTKEDEDYLKELEIQAENLREELKELGVN